MERQAGASAPPLIGRVRPDSNFYPSQELDRTTTGNDATSKPVSSARIGLAVLFVAAAGVAAFAIRREVLQQQKITQAEGLVNTLVNADTAQVPEIAEQVRENARWTEPLLRQRLAQCEDDSIEKLHISPGTGKPATQSKLSICTLSCCAPMPRVSR